MRINLLIYLLLISSLLVSIDPHFAQDPAVSPRAEKICFSYMSDLWIVPSEGGFAERITVSSGTDRNPHYSPDGEKIAFNTNRDGWNCIYLMSASGGKAEPISRDEFELLDWFPDSKHLLVARGEPGLSNKFFKLNLRGEFEELTSFGGSNARLNPKGNKILFGRGGLIYREAYKGSFNGELWIYDLNDETFQRLTHTDLTEQYPLFSNQKDKIYFAASDGKNFQLYSTFNYNIAERKQLTDFDSFSVRNLDISRERDLLVFELFDQIWKYDAEIGQISKVEIDIRQDFLSTSLVREELVNKVDLFDVSPQGDFIVFSAKYDLFAIPEKGGDVKQITFNQKGIKDIYISPDNKTVYFVSYDKGNPELFRFMIDNIEEVEKINWFNDKYIEELSGYGEYILINYSDKKKKHNLALGFGEKKDFKTIMPELFFFSEPSASPDSSYIAVIEIKQHSWSGHLHLYNIDSGIDKLIYSYEGQLKNPAWGKDHKSLFFSHDREIYRLDLLAKKDFYTEKDHWQEILTDLNRDEKKDTTVTKPNGKIEIDFVDIALRVAPVVTQTGWNEIVHVIDDSTFYYLNEFEEEYYLRKGDYYGEDDEKIHKFHKNPKGLQFNEKNKAFYYVENKMLKKLDPNSKKVSPVKTKIKYSYDRIRLNQDIFDQVWVEFGEGFYDPEMHGVDWKKLYKFFSPYLDYVISPRDLRKIIYEMIGEVNASHTGFYPRDENKHELFDIAYCGFILDDKGYNDTGIRIKKVFRKSKLAKPAGIESGDILVSIDGLPVGTGKELYSQLVDKVGEKLRLGIVSGDSLQIITIKGLSRRENYSLFYDHWVEERSEIVKEASEGRIGYLHIRSMSNRSYEKFIQDIFTDNFNKEALIIDVRNNGGGHIHDKLIEVLTREPYAWVSVREFNSIRQRVPFRIWDKPLVVMINERSFSDAEIFPGVFKDLKLGKVIGMPTSGSVIGTSHHFFMDGSSMRMPLNGWYRDDGTNMEGNGVMPDILIEPTPTQIINDEDIQLKKAVEVLLEQLESN